MKPPSQPLLPRSMDTTKEMISTYLPLLLLLQSLYYFIIFIIFKSLYYYFIYIYMYSCFICFFFYAQMYKKRAWFVFWYILYEFQLPKYINNNHTTVFLDFNLFLGSHFPHSVWSRYTIFIIYYLHILSFLRILIGFYWSILYYYYYALFLQSTQNILFLV